MFNVEVRSPDHRGGSPWGDWKLEVGGELLTAPCQDGFYPSSEVDVEFTSFMIALPDILEGEEVTVPFIDDPHEFRVKRRNDHVTVTLVWKTVHYRRHTDASGRPRTETTWTQEEYRGTVPVEEFVLGLWKLGRRLQHLLRIRDNAYVDPWRLSNLKKGLKTVRRTAKRLGLKPVDRD